MRIHLLLCAVLIGLFAASTGLAQEEGPYIDTMSVQVKFEKMADFESVTKKFVDVHRRTKADYWVASESAYGEGGWVYFVSVRPKLAAVDTAMESSMKALTDAYGPAGMMKLFQDFGATLTQMRSELWRLRPDLSLNTPADPAGLMKLVGASRWAHILTVRVRPGKLLDYLTMWKQMREAMQSGGAKPAIFVSQAATGGLAVRFVTYGKAMADFDQPPFALMKSVGEENYRKAMTVAADTVLSSETTIRRFRPDLSNPQEEIIAAAPEFWKPKPAPPAPKAAPKKK